MIQDSPYGTLYLGKIFAGCATVSSPGSDGTIRC
jgi:hypothetical protein